MYEPATVELPKYQSKPGGCREAHTGAQWFLFCTHAIWIEAGLIRVILAPFHLLGNMQTNPLLLGQRMDIFAFVIKAVI